MTADRRHVDVLHELIDSDPIENATEQLGDSTDSRDEAIDEALAHTGLDALSPDAQRYLLTLAANTESVEPATRHKLVDAATRGIQHHRNDTSALPRLLFLRRRQLKTSLEAVAQRIGVPADQLAAVERGRAPIESITAPNVASWIQALHVDADQARESLRHALELQKREDLAIAAASAAVSLEDDEFIQKVMALLNAQQR